MNTIITPDKASDFVDDFMGSVKNEVVENVSRKYKQFRFTFKADPDEGRMQDFIAEALRVWLEERNLRGIR